MPYTKRINILRPASPTGLGASQTPEMFQHDTPAFIKFKAIVFFNMDGHEMISDGELMLDTSIEIKAGDVLEIFPATDKKYKIESIEELHNVHGTLLGYKGVFARDTSLE